MSTVGIRELRQQTSNVVRRAESGEEIIVTVNGHPAAQISPLPKGRWRRGSELAELFLDQTDPHWGADLRQGEQSFDDTLRDPWDQSPA